MTPERWRQIQELCQSVAEKLPDEQQSILRVVRARDPELCAQAEALLRQSGDKTATGERPASQDSQPGDSPAGQLVNDRYRLTGQLVNDRYRLTREIGHGGFGVVWLARDERLHDKPVVVKFLIGATRRDEWSDKKFADEVKALARIDHPGVVIILDKGQTKGVPFLVMQHVEGVTLRSLIGPAGMPLTRVAEIMRQIGRALAAAHACGILHRDLKPENIMVQTTSSGDFVRLIDFGIATIRDEGRTGQPTRVVGTPAYMAPEQLLGQPCVATDVFAMGLIAWEMLMGKLPASHVGELPDVPRQALAAIRRALSADPASRFQNALEFGEELAAALVIGATPAPPGESSERVQQRVLDVAASRQLPIHKPAEVVALIRRTESGGLSAILEVERDYSVTKEDVRSKPFRLEFPVDAAGLATPLELGLRIECPDFEPPGGFKTIQVPPDRDSEACTFLVTPRYLGELRINLEVVRGDVLVASRTLKTEAVSSDRVVDSSKTLVSMTLPVIVRESEGTPPLKLRLAAQIKAVEELLQQGRLEEARAMLQVMGPLGAPPAPERVGSLQDPPPRNASPETGSFMPPSSEYTRMITRTDERTSAPDDSEKTQVIRKSKSFGPAFPQMPQPPPPDKPPTPIEEVRTAYAVRQVRAETLQSRKAAKSSRLALYLAIALCGILAAALIYLLLTK